MPVQLLSIVVPVYNSVETLETLHVEISKTLGGRQAFELILVDDGSKDESWSKIISLREKDPDHVRGIRLSKNFGQHNAIVCGLGFAKGDAIVTMDDDMQHPPSEIPKLIEQYNSTGADVVYGIYNDKKQHDVVRKAGSSFLQRSSKYVSGNTGVGSSFRLIKKSLTEKVIGHKLQSNVFIDEILHWYTSRFATVQVEHHPRKAGKSGYTYFRLFFMYLDLLVNYTAVPLKMMTWIGLLSSFVTFALGIRFIYKKLAHDVQPGFTAQIVTILFSTSLLMFCMGIIGQYLQKIYLLQSKRPNWSIDEVI
jgi:polyisoprenyl-phosphate glycosyltransferase